MEKESPSKKNKRTTSVSSNTSAALSTNKLELMQRSRQKKEIENSFEAKIKGKNETLEEYGINQLQRRELRRFEKEQAEENKKTKEGAWYYPKKWFNSIFGPKQEKKDTYLYSETVDNVLKKQVERKKRARQKNC